MIIVFLIESIIYMSLPLISIYSSVLFYAGKTLIFLLSLFFVIFLFKKNEIKLHKEFIVFFLLIFISLLMIPYSVLNGNNLGYIIADTMGILVIILIMIAFYLYMNLILNYAKLIKSLLTIYFIIFIIYFCLVFFGFVIAKIPAIHIFVFSMLLILFFTEQRKIFLFWALLSFIEGTYLGESRGFVVEAIFVFFVYIFLLKKYRHIILITALLVFLMPVFLKTALHSYVFLSLSQFIKDVKSDPSFFQRILEVKLQFDYLSKNGVFFNYIFGFGPGAEYIDYTGVTGKYKQHHAHITPIFMYFKFGILGLMSWAYLWYIVFKGIIEIKIKKIYRRDFYLGKIYLLSYFGILSYGLQTLIGQEFLFNPLLGMFIGSYMASKKFLDQKLCPDWWHYIIKSGIEWKELKNYLIVGGNKMPQVLHRNAKSTNYIRRS